MRKPPQFTLPSHKGQAGEFLFIAECLIRNISVSHAGEGMAYDIVTDVAGNLHRVQVKTIGGTNGRNQKRTYRVPATGCNSRGKYKENAIDVIAAHVIPEKTWWLFPFSILKGRTCLSLVPGTDNWKLYKNNWKLYKNNWKLYKNNWKLLEGETK